MIQVLSFGDRIETGCYEPHSRFSRAANFTKDGRLVAIVAPELGGGPINIIMDGPDFQGLSWLRISEDSFTTDCGTFPKSPVFDSRLPRRSADPEKTKRDLRRWRDLLLRKAHPKSLAFLMDGTRRSGLSSGFEKALAGRLEAAARDLRSGDLRSAAQKASGAGFGLTPSGDDLLSGYLWGLHLRQRLNGGDFAADIEDIYGAARSVNPLSAAFLRCAREGRFFAHLRDMLAAIGSDGPEQIEIRLDALLSMGETSGADTCVGLMLALEEELS